MKYGGSPLESRHEILVDGHGVESGGSETHRKFLV